MDDVERIPMEGSFSRSGRELDIKTSAAYIFDDLSALDYGRVALIYRHPVQPSTASAGAAGEASSSAHQVCVHDGLKVKSLPPTYDEPEVWMQDASARWYFVCESFTQYFRLAVTHLGRTVMRIVATSLQKTCYPIVTFTHQESLVGKRPSRLKACRLQPDSGWECFVKRGFYSILKTFHCNCGLF